MAKRGRGRLSGIELLPAEATPIIAWAADELRKRGEVPCQWIVGPVERVEGEVRLTLILPHGSNPSEAVAFPEPITVITGGPISLPEDSHVDA